MSGRSLLEKCAGPGRPLRLLLVLLLGLEALAAASHVPSGSFYLAEVFGSEVFGSEASSRSSGDRPSTDDPADCPLCHLPARMNDALAQPGTALFLSAVLIGWGTRPASAGQTHRTRSRGWRSRAPPLFPET